MGVELHRALIGALGVVEAAQVGQGRRQIDHGRAALRVNGERLPVEADGLVEGAMVGRIAALLPERLGIQGHRGDGRRLQGGRRSQYRRGAQRGRQGEGEKRAEGEGASSHGYLPAEGLPGNYTHAGSRL
ncbi:hypothetical protein D3C72_684960 [compost metagenome]